ncbi:hypothetical protein CHS0354_003664 [Potamilus streckersoni]|uniref:Uncharacterized protein n=1 Tax=Potamilus streckersoni TaxID=2493646 RepID=A0AAE0SS80_9BIVA|nr:hypothetical protein CHS0354_003664 [Potamilus streckersoni]
MVATIRAIGVYIPVSYTKTKKNICMFIVLQLKVIAQKHEIRMASGIRKAHIPETHTCTKSTCSTTGKTTETVLQCNIKIPRGARKADIPDTIGAFE